VATGAILVVGGISDANCGLILAVGVALQPFGTDGLHASRIHGLRHDVTVGKDLLCRRADEQNCRNSTDLSEGMFHNVSLIGFGLLPL
jgi:hypothetical protein